MPIIIFEMFKKKITFLFRKTIQAFAIVIEFENFP